MFKGLFLLQGKAAPVEIEIEISQNNPKTAARTVDYVSKILIDSSKKKAAENVLLEWLSCAPCINTYVGQLYCCSSLRRKCQNII